MTKGRIICGRKTKGRDGRKESDRKLKNGKRDGRGRKIAKENGKNRGEDREMKGGKEY